MLAHAVQARRIIESRVASSAGGAARRATDILPEEAAAAIRADPVKRGAPAQARNAFGHGSRMFSWAIGTHEFGITASPFASLRAVGARREEDAPVPCAGGPRAPRESGRPPTAEATAEAVADARRRDVKKRAARPAAGLPIRPAGCG